MDSLNKQINIIGSDLLQVYGIDNLSDNSPKDIATARLICEERGVEISLTKEQIALSQSIIKEIRLDRHSKEREEVESGGYLQPDFKPTQSRLPMRRRQNKNQWCHITNAVMMAEDSGYILDNHRKAIENYTPLKYDWNPHIRHRFCGYDTKTQKYYCDAAQEYAITLIGHSPYSNYPGDPCLAIEKLTGKSISSIGNGRSSFWFNLDGTLDIRKMNFLANSMKVPAIIEAYVEGNVCSGKGHTFLVHDFVFDGIGFTFFTEDSVFGEKTVISSFSDYIESSVYAYKTKITNIRYFV